MKCFNCGADLKPNSIKCPVCGFAPDVEFMRKCPNLNFGKCSLTNSMCRFLGQYQTCPIKNDAERDFDY